MPSHDLHRRRLPRHTAQVKAYVACSLSANTQRAYATDVARFKAWGGKIPCPAARLANYVAAHAGLLKDQHTPAPYGGHQPCPPFCRV